MKILLLASGGDAPGTNRFIWDIFSVFKDDVYFAQRGFAGLVEDMIFPLSTVVDRKLKNKAGAVIKSSRYPKFKEEMFFKKGVENAKNFDVVVVLGGNGSQKGAKALYENGINTIFVPTTIDNDVEDSFYSIGFSTAVKECVYAVQNVMPSIETMGDSCLFQVMGRHCDKIANAVGEIVGADYVVSNKEDLDFEKIKQIILDKYVKSQSACIIVRENIVELEKIIKKLDEMIGMQIVKKHIVGRTQRGGAPTKEELSFAKQFAKQTTRCILNKDFGACILVDENNKIFVKNFW